MKHLTRDEVALQQMLRRARIIAVVGASPRADRHSNTVCRYLHDQGYEVIPLRPDLADVARIKSYAQLDDVAGPVDLVVIFRNARAAPAHVAEAALKRPEAVWLPPGVTSRACVEAALSAGLTLVEDSCIMEEHRHASRGAGHPSKLGVHVRRRARAVVDNRKRQDDSGWSAGGGGGHLGGGGVRATLDEKKMVTGRPSPRKGRAKVIGPQRLRGRHRH
ncbi:MAG: CoA-binding domain protein [Myxococcales bacterium]|nr:CoA-binding domain protein [Myxococcales bacterium]